MTNTRSNFNMDMLSQKNRVEARLKKRHAAEKRFRLYGVAAIFLALCFLFVLFGSIITKGYSAFWQTEMRLTVTLPTSEFGDKSIEAIKAASHASILKSSLREMFPDVKSRNDKRKLYKIVSEGAKFELRDIILENPALIGQTVDLWFAASDDIDMMNKGYIDRTLPEADRRIDDFTIALVDTMSADGRIDSVFNTRFFSNADSREPEQAGIRGAAIGSFWTLLVTLLLSFPIGVAAAIYLEEFA
ncbi:MAG: DUF3333 domain-containing protein, partial [Alphaproteobacteria bacterium]|nr:DUF3333 domain-containing protein [Alphaproteobacteria bacterium]